MRGKFQSLYLEVLIHTHGFCSICFCFIEFRFQAAEYRDLSHSIEDAPTIKCAFNNWVIDLSLSGGRCG